MGFLKDVKTVLYSLYFLIYDMGRIVAGSMVNPTRILLVIYETKPFLEPCKNEKTSFAKEEDDIVEIMVEKTCWMTW